MNTGNNFLDRLLLTKDFYRNITDKKPGLYIGIILVGMIDLLAPMIDKFSRIFVGKTQTVLCYNIILTALFIILIGLVDVLFFSLPLFDLFKVFKKEVEVQSSSRLLVKIMKIQIVANLLVFIPSILVYILNKNVDIGEYPFIGEIIFILSILIFIWYCAAISRGINSIYSFKPVYRMWVFNVVFLWAFILSNFSISYVIDNLMIGLFK